MVCTLGYPIAVSVIMLSLKWLFRILSEDFFQPNTLKNQMQMQYLFNMGSMDSSVVKTLNWNDWKVVGSSPCRVSFLCWLFFWYPFYKISQSFCQKCRWQVAAKHACTLHMWLCMKRNGAWLYGVHRMCQDGSSFMWHQPCQCCKYTTLVDIQKCTIKSWSLM